MLILEKKTGRILMQFLILYLCKQYQFFTFINIKTNKQIKLELIDEEMRVYL